MQKFPLLLLTPTGNHPSAMDQSFGARLAASQRLCRDQMVLEEDSFQQDDLDQLEEVVSRWAGKVCGVVGATSVPESRRLGELSEELKFLCFVSNNNPTVWQGRSHIFHIGVPTPMIASGIAERLLRHVGLRRIYILHETREFQSNLASTTASVLKSGGAEVCCRPVSQGDWLGHVKTWGPDLVYLACSDEVLAIPLVQSIRRGLPNLPLLVGMSLLRDSFLSSLGELAEGLFLADIFYRGEARREQEKIFVAALNSARVKIPTANHAFGWDTMMLCAAALASARGEISAAIRHLESGIELEGATGYLRFSPNNHNGHATFNPITLSGFKNGRVEMYRAAA